MENTDSPQEKKPTSKPKTAPKWETDSKERIRAAIKRYSKPLADMCARGANEGDTRLVITDFLCDGLGFDKYTDITTEYRVKGEFADFGLKLDGQMMAFIEVKRVNTALGEKHLRQVQAYALNEGCEWVILCNGHVWQLYHITAGLPVVTDLVHEADLLGEQSPAQKVKDFFFLSREYFKRGLVKGLWEERRASSPESLAKTILSESVLNAIRKEHKKRTGQMLDLNQLAELVKETVIKKECL
jgi:hypothetical protein